MKDSEHLKLFLSQYEQYVRTVLQPTYDEFRILLRQWREPAYWSKYTKKSRMPAPSPIQRTYIRIKRPESVVDKVMRKPSLFPDGLAPESFYRMNDTLGARAVVYFLSQLPMVDQEFRNHEGIEISEEWPPIAYLSEDLTTRYGLAHLKRQDKESGYASVHYIMRQRDSEIPPEQRPWFELQVRTLCEDLWGEVEHILGYKPNKRTSFAVRKQFQILSKELSAIDEHFNFLYEELQRFQEEGTFKDTDPLNAENLPPVLSEVEIGCAQKEIDGILKLLFSRGVGTVGRLRGIATARRMDFIRDAYRSTKGRGPTNFEVVATLATLSTVEESEGDTNLIKAQIAYLDAWDALKKGFPT